jgi:hypothetical protein
MSDDPTEKEAPAVPGTVGVQGSRPPDPANAAHPERRSHQEAGREIDLDQGQKGPPAPANPPEVTPPTYPDKIRGRIALALIALLTAIVFASFLTIWLGVVFHRLDFKDLKDLLTIVFGPLVALASAAVGYYFGGKPGSSG